MRRPHYPKRRQRTHLYRITDQLNVVQKGSLRLLWRIFDIPSTSTKFSISVPLRFLTGDTSKSRVKQPRYILVNQSTWNRRLVTYWLLIIKIIFKEFPFRVWYIPQENNTPPVWLSELQTRVRYKDKGVPPGSEPILGTGWTHRYWWMCRVLEDTHFVRGR